MVGDHYRDKWKDWQTSPVQPGINYPSDHQYVILKSGNEITREEFDALKKEVEEMKALLIRAAKYDEENNEPHCEMDEKVELLKKIAEAVGVNLEDVFGNHK